eukprot:224548-Hanusia_phi.AAC.2
MDDTRAVPAEDPFLRLSREREREYVKISCSLIRSLWLKPDRWRGTTVRMMTGQNDEDGSFLNRYITISFKHARLDPLPKALSPRARHGQPMTESLIAVQLSFIVGGPVGPAERRRIIAGGAATEDC